jgi:hypothetical protein
MLEKCNLSKIDVILLRASIQFKFGQPIIILYDLGLQKSSGLNAYKGMWYTLEKEIDELVG